LHHPGLNERGCQGRVPEGLVYEGSRITTTTTTKGMLKVTNSKDGTNVECVCECAKVSLAPSKGRNLKDPETNYYFYFYF
jgi:hypothetical protein